MRLCPAPTHTASPCVLCRQQEKEPLQMRKELSGVMRQISSSVAFLPLLADLCESFSWGLLGSSSRWTVHSTGWAAMLHCVKCQHISFLAVSSCAAHCTSL